MPQRRAGQSATSMAQPSPVWTHATSIWQGQGLEQELSSLSGRGSKSLASHRGSPDSHRVIAIGRSSEAVGGAKSRVEDVEGGQVDRRRGEVLRGEIKVKTGDAQRSPGAGEESSRGR